MAFAFEFADGLDTAGKSKPIPNAYALNHTVQFGITAGVAEGDTFSLEGTIDKVAVNAPDTYAWSVLAQHSITADEVTAGVVMFHVVGKVVTGIRGSIDSLSGGALTSPKYMPDESITRNYRGC